MSAMKTLFIVVVLVLSSLALLPVGGVILTRQTTTLSEAPTIYDIQYTEDPSGDSTYDGQEVLLTGVVTAEFFNGYFIADAPGAWHAIYVYTQNFAPELGDLVEVAGRVQEYYGMTEIVNVSGYQVLSSGHEISHLALEIGDIAQEAYESVLIQVEDVSVTSLEGNGEWVISDGLASIRCDDMVDYMYFPQLGDNLESVTGILYYSFGDFKIEPRKTNDIAGEVIPHYALRGDIVTMNEKRAVILDSYLEILGDEIMGVHSVQPAGIQVFSTDGLIFPGLIDAHNHPHYNVLDLIPFDQYFSDRYEWQSDPLYDSFKDQYYDIRDYGGYQSQMTDLFKLAEVRALSAGTTMIQGYSAYGHQYDDFAHQGIGINNAERFPSRILPEVFPLRETPSYWQEKQGEYWDRFVIHLSEGITPAALGEFSEWQSLVTLDSRTSIIHGVPYGSAEWSAMAAANASLIWSPASNLSLYGTTADIPGALAAGVNVALAPDWTESGTPNILDEMKVADQVNWSSWGGIITPLQLAEFVTRNAAYALG
ncbi:MAG: hypothetical protein KAS38_06110, partial [Anaerolineales bacterium]|nr:hypothetical protein [Anaerolineales bacterium]